MEPRLSFIFKMSFVALICLHATHAFAFYRIRTEGSGQKVFWRTTDIPIKRAHEGSFAPEHMTENEYIQAIDAAYVQWTSITDSSLAFTSIFHDDPIFTGLYLQTTTPTDPHLGINSIHMIGPEWINAGGPAWSSMGLGGSGTIAVTLSFMRGPNGGIARRSDIIDGALVDADIVFNDIDFNFCAHDIKNCAASEMDLITVATHEIGHQIGLEHQHDDTASVMYRSIRYAEIKTVRSDEVSAVQCIYPLATNSSSHQNACKLEQGGGAPPGSGTSLYGNNQPDNSGACAGIAPTGRPKPPRSQGMTQFGLTLMLMILATLIGKRKPATLFPFNRRRWF